MTLDQWDKRYEETVKVLHAVGDMGKELAKRRAINYMNTNYGPRPVETPESFHIGITATVSMDKGKVLVNARASGSWLDEKELREVYRSLGKFVDYYDRHAQV